jgi:hypothetical protein
MDAARCKSSTCSEGKSSSADATRGLETASTRTNPRDEIVSRSLHSCQSSVAVRSLSSCYRIGLGRLLPFGSLQPLLSSWVAAGGPVKQSFSVSCLHCRSCLDVESGWGRNEGL